MSGVRWKRSTGDYVESHDGRWWITPIYGVCTRPERYKLRYRGEPTDGWRVVGSGSTQRECKEEAEQLSESWRNPEGAALKIQRS